uniref:Uncharacterized protein n=1 Tax=Anguilla anguilla TaxID=7936 RepID=A0A0E9W170_ANGAN
MFSFPVLGLQALKLPEVAAIHHSRKFDTDEGCTWYHYFK